MSRVSTGAKELVLEVKRGRNMVTQGRKSRWNQGGSWNAGTEKPDPYCPSLLYVVTINGFQVLLSSISCLPLNPWGEGICLTLPPPSIHAHAISKWPARPLSHSLYPGYKSGLRTLFNLSSPLSWPTVLTASSTLINFISFSFCLMSGNSIPTRAQTMTEKHILVSLKV